MSSVKEKYEVEAKLNRRQPMPPLVIKGDHNHSMIPTCYHHDSTSQDLMKKTSESGL